MGQSSTAPPTINLTTRRR